VYITEVIIYVFKRGFIEISIYRSAMYNKKIF